MRTWLGVAALGLTLGVPAAWAKEAAPSTVGGGHMQHCPSGDVWIRHPRIRCRIGADSRARDRVDGTRFCRHSCGSAAIDGCVTRQFRRRKPL